MFTPRTLIAVCAVSVTAGCHRQASMEDHSAHMSPAPAGSAVSADVATALPASNGKAAARLAASPRRGQWTKIAFAAGSKDSLMAWVVYPANTRAKAPVVIVVHDIGGLSPWARAVADQAAAEGFIGISPDFTSRDRGPSQTELTPDSARKLVGTLESAERNRVIAAAASYGMAQASAEKRYAVIGYCWGGSTVFMHAINGGTNGFAGGVGFYGLPYMNGAVPNADSLAKIKTPVMLFNGSKDARIGASMPVLDSIMKKLGKNYVSKNFEGATHGFLRSQDDPKAQRDLAEEAANLAATKEAWPRTVEFLKKNLSVK